MRRSALAVGMAVLALTLSAGSAAAADRYASPALDAIVTVESTQITSATRQLQAHVQLTAGPRRIAFDFRAYGPTFQRSVAGRPVKEGETLKLVRMRTRTPGSNWVYSGSGSSGGWFCGFGQIGRQLPHGAGAGGYKDRGMVLEAKQSVTFDLTYDIAPDAPWIGASYTPIVRLGPITRRMGPDELAIPRGTPSLKRSVILRPSEVTMAGPYAARIDLDSSPKYTPGQPVTISGTLVPAQAGKRVNISVARLNFKWMAQPTMINLGSAITDAAGHFSLPGWIPGRKGYYTVHPSYPAQEGDLVADEMCPTLYTSARGLIPDA